MKYVFIIAIDKYQDKHFPKLNNAKIDAERFLRVVKEKYGFQLLQEPLFDENATRKGIIESLNSLTNNLNYDDWIIIYFAGHGSIHPKTSKGYWIPYDAEYTLSDYIPNSTIKDIVHGVEAKHLLLISDSCFSGSFLTQSRGISEKYYDKLIEKKSRWYFSSGRIEKVSDGEPGVGSPFAVALNEYLEQNDSKQFSLTELFAGVCKQTGITSKQQPIYGCIEETGHQGGEIVFELIDESKTSLKFETDNELQRIVVPFDIAMKLKDFGFAQNSIFGYYKTNNKIIVQKKTISDNFICSAYIFDEVASFIPEEIEVNENTYIARFDGFDKIKIKDLEFYYAEVTYQKTGVTDKPYMAICRFKGRMVAFSITNEGLYNNLICWGNNQAEAAGEMLIALFKENKINSY